MLSFATKFLEVESLDLDLNILEAAYDLYLEAPQSSHPLISLKALSERTGTTPLKCRNAIIKACKTGRFPNCSLAL